MPHPEEDDQSETVPPTNEPSTEDEAEARPRGEQGTQDHDRYMPL